ncbi:ABC transporter permease [Roseospirillum parvum]|uniref:Putative spermidine/putrescine transport system permease protein n=1 Tax=Roseospirillum parvum TaxID=83401 RepID=A0A1G8EFF7_9PROT|nr:ABC transporter permease [Roseospirillum parvum]SDH68638.1 putative spermidine/putrescine transport system permease protein [Roseospirillum parvum]
MPTAAPSFAPPEPSLKARLRRAERLHHLKAGALILPLAAFLAVTFLIPIGDMMRRAVHDPELAQVWPGVTAAIDDWQPRTEAPGEAVFAALAADLGQSKADRTLAVAARRLNSDYPGARSLLFSSARKLPETAESWRATLIHIDERWAEPELWAAIDRASGPLTAFFLLQAVDLERTPTGQLRPVPEQEAVFLDILGRTFAVALTVTLLCLALGFPVAYLLATLPPHLSNPMMILVLLPFWTSLLVRTAAWVVLLQDQGLVNNALIWLGLLDEPARLIFNRIGVIIAMTHVLLPFLVLPLYSVMKGIPKLYMRTALSLGARPTVAFLKVYLPQTLPGIVAGTLLTFIIALGYYITPALVGGAADQMISYFIAFYTAETVNWGMAAALGSVLLVTTLILFATYARLVRAGATPAGR